MRFVIVAILICGFCFSNCKFDGVFDEADEGKRLRFATLFLPYDPLVKIYTQDSFLLQKCEKFWPNRRLINDVNQHCDLILIEDDGFQWSSIKCLKQASVIYITTKCHETSHYNIIDGFLTSSGFRMLSHWYIEGQNGEVIFVRNDLFDIAMKSLNYTPSQAHMDAPWAYDLNKFFHGADNKSSQHQLQEIDFIYMINLDERPEKYALARSGLQSFGIYPYRFSAVNGWKLPAAIFDRIGVKLRTPLPNEKLMGTTYSIGDDGIAYWGSEILDVNRKAYFSLGMSRGAIGIVLSHLSVLQDALNAGFATIWVMEDDVEAVSDPSEIPALIRKLDELVGDWDILFTDTDTKNSVGQHVSCRSIAARPNINIPSLSSFMEKFYPISDDLSRIGMRYGAYSMIIRRSGMEKILKYYQTYGVYLPYDMDFWLIPGIKMFSVNKDIVSHRAHALTDNGAPNYNSKVGP